MKITYIPPKPKRISRIGVYCRVSTTNKSQYGSLENQINHFKDWISKAYEWKLIDIYIDRSSGKSSARPDFQRMLQDCHDGRIDTIMTKSISHFGRNTVDTIDALQRIKAAGVDVIFEVEGIRLSDSDSEFYISVFQAHAQEESRAKSENIRWGLQKSFESGTTKLFRRKCFGYTHNDNGELIIHEEHAKIVRLIFDLYLQGHSIVSIIRELKTQDIKSPTGMDNWSKRAIETILTNKKYVGKVILGKTYGEEFPTGKRHLNRGEKTQYTANESHDAIISSEIFDAVITMREQRSNIKIVDDKVVRKSTHYSMKKKEK
jgi:Site-specific recombinases, DNA invertase Pin homologs